MIIDGGLGVELTQRGFAYSTALWSGEAILAQPELLVEIHRAYLAAGAEILETATYQLSHATLRRLDFSDEAIDDVFARAVHIARDAIDAQRAETGTPGEYLVAASLGPFGATLGDGSEYSGVQHLERDALYAFHAERARSVARAGPDLILFETIPSAIEARVVAEVARDLGLRRVWVSLSCSDDARTYGGDRVADIAAVLDTFACVEVVGVNCTAPEFVASLVGALKVATAKSIMVCPNLGQHWETDTHALAGGSSEAEFLRRVPEWMALGVTHIGGCCGVGPTTINALTTTVAALQAKGANNQLRNNG